MAVERIAVLEIGVHHGVAAVAAEAFEPGGMHAEIRMPEIAMPDKGYYRAYEGREGGREGITGLLHRIARFA